MERPKDRLIGFIPGLESSPAGSQARDFQKGRKSQSTGLHLDQKCISPNRQTNKNDP
jgi:hypothetical protein